MSREEVFERLNEVFRDVFDDEEYAPEKVNAEWERYFTGIAGE